LAIIGVVCALGVVHGGASAAGAPVSVEQSGWLWSNPTPQGETLNDVAFDEARGYAVGQNGTVLRSDDGGLTWSALPSETHADLSEVQALDPNTVIVGGGCTLRESTNAGASFQRLPVTASEHGCESEIVSFSFLSANAGYIKLADGEILLTTDGGKTVEAKEAVQSGSTGNIEFLTPTTGFTITDNKSGGEILRTVDGATSWKVVVSSPAQLSQLTFVTPTVGYAVGPNSTLLRTADGGETWTVQPLTLPPGTRPLDLTQIACGDATHCLITNEPRSFESGSLVRTSDGGLTGTLVNAAAEATNDEGLLSVAFAGASTAVTVGEEGRTFISDNGGKTFASPGYSRLENVSGERRIRIGQSPLDAYMALEEDGEIAATTDGGLSWSVLHVPVEGALADVAFPSTQVGYAVSSEGAFLKTTTAGRTWSIMQSLDGIPSAVLAPNDETVLVITNQGVFRSTDGGSTFQKLDPTVVIGRRRGRLRTARLSTFDISNDAYLAGGAVFAFGADLVHPEELFQNSVLESTDDGTHWSILPPPVPKEEPYAISFLSPTTGYESSDGRLFFTRNRGRTWTKILSLGSNTEPLYPPENLSFSSVKDGYIFLNYERRNYEPTLLRTENGGRSWTPEYIPFAIGQILAAGAVDYAADEVTERIFETTDGGLSPNRSTLTLAIVGRRHVSVAQLRRASGNVRLVGHLSPAAGGETVTISYLTEHEFFWHHRTVTVNSKGAFAMTAVGIKATTNFVAQYNGNDLVGGAGTPAVQITVTHTTRSR
jgi:photosystem II stability/assembly factor-like uncharacterized protein